MFPLDQLDRLNVKITRLVTDSRAVQQAIPSLPIRAKKRMVGNSSPRRLRGARMRSHENVSGPQREVRHFVWNDAWQIPNLAVSDLRHKAGWLADAVYGAPSEKLWLVGVTGTNGKTSTSHWIAHALNDAGKKCALIGTLGNGFVDALQASANTTPDAIRVHGLLADYLRADAQAVAMEVSSHALAQGRVNGVHFDVALLTNLSRDHLDVHGTMERYEAAKAMLFEWPGLKHAVINLDDPVGCRIAAHAVERGVDVIGCSAMPTCHRPIAPRLLVWQSADGGRPGVRTVCRRSGASGRQFAWSAISTWPICSVSSACRSHVASERHAAAVVATMVPPPGGCSVSTQCAAAGRGRLRTHARCAGQGARSVATLGERPPGAALGCVRRRRRP